MKKVVTVGSILLSITMIIGVVGLRTGVIHKPDWRSYLNTYLDPYSTHPVLESEGKSLPLPPHSTLQFRYSNEGAFYYTRLSQEDVLGFYQKTGSVKEHFTNGDKVMLTVSHEGVCFLIQASPGFRSGTLMDVKAQ